MKSIRLSNIVRKTLALTLVGYFSIFSPLTALAVVQPVSAPITIPVPVPIPGTPQMVYPQDGQTLDLEGTYMFKVKPVAGASGYVFGFFQNRVMIFENYRDTRQLSPNGEFVLRESDSAHARFHSGEVKIVIRALVNNQWTGTREITITLRPRVVASPAPSPTPAVSPFPSPTPIGIGTTAPIGIVRTNRMPIKPFLPFRLRLPRLFNIFSK